MQELDLLEDFVARFSVLGWTSRQQFEEIWVGLLAIVGFNTQGNTPPEETAFIVQVQFFFAFVCIFLVTVIPRHTSRARLFITSQKELISVCEFNGGQRNVENDHSVKVNS